MVTASLKCGLPVCHQLPGIQKLVLAEPVSGPTTLFRKGAPWGQELTWSRLEMVVGGTAKWEWTSRSTVTCSQLLKCMVFGG